MNYLKMSLKQKSLFFILLLISILLLTLYVQHKTAYKNYLYLLQDTYKTSLDNNHKIFLNNLNNNYSNLRIYFQNDEIYKYVNEKNKYVLNKKAQDLLTILQDTNESLKDISILIEPNELEVLKKQKKLINFVKIENILYYKLSYPLVDYHYEYAVIEFLIDAKMFLHNIKEYNQSSALMYFVNNNDTAIEKNLSSIQDNENLEKILSFAKNENNNLLNIDSKFYVTKVFDFKDVNNLCLSKVIFFLDVTKEKLEYKNIIKNSLTTSILLFIFAAIIVNYFFNFLIKRINKNEDKLKEINKNLEYTVENEIQQRLEIQHKAQEEKEQNEQLLIQQSKLAMMGEMIGNIAHQWRQPLMQLGAIIMYLDAYNDKGKLTKERFQKKIADGVSIIDFMSRTIEDFRNYYQPEKQKEEFFIKQSIDSALFIIESTLKNSYIKIEIYYENENLKITSFKNEFSQALLNIISNAKDILIQREIKDPKIIVSVYEENRKCIISIEDNAGGINDEIIDKVFDPYFTTKHKSQGTGIGLYMTKMIIENNMSGKIEVKNSDIGAKFIVIL